MGSKHKYPQAFLDFFEYVGKVFEHRLIEDERIKVRDLGEEEFWVEKADTGGKFAINLDMFDQYWFLYVPDPVPGDVWEGDNEGMILRATVVEVIDDWVIYQIPEYASNLDAHGARKIEVFKQKFPDRVGDL